MDCKRFNNWQHVNIVINDSLLALLCDACGFAAHVYVAEGDSAADVELP